MDPILQTFLSWQFLIFGVGVVAVVFVLRKIGEYGLANWKPLMKESKLWNDLLMPILPIIVGALGALAIRSYPYPNNLTSGGSRFVFGLGAGLLSTVLYRLITALISQRISAAISQNPGVAVARAVKEDNATSSTPTTVGITPVTIGIPAETNSKANAVLPVPAITGSNADIIEENVMSAGVINKE